MEGRGNLVPVRGADLVAMTMKNEMEVGRGSRLLPVCKERAHRTRPATERRRRESEMDARGGSRLFPVCKEGARRTRPVVITKKRKEQRQNVMEAEKVGAILLHQNFWINASKQTFENFAKQCSRILECRNNGTTGKRKPKESSRQVFSSFS